MLRIGDRIQGVELVGLIRNSARLLRKVKVINLNPGTELIAINNGVCAGSTVINDAAFAGFSVARRRTSKVTRRPVRSSPADSLQLRAAGFTVRLTRFNGTCRLPFRWIRRDN